MSSKVWKYDWVFYVVLSAAVLYTARSNLKNEDTGKSDCFRNFYAFFKTRGANVTLVSWKGCQLRKRLGTDAVDVSLQHSKGQTVTKHTTQIQAFARTGWSAVPVSTSRHFLKYAEHSKYTRRIQLTTQPWPVRAELAHLKSRAQRPNSGKMPVLLLETYFASKNWTLCRNKSFHRRK